MLISSIFPDCSFVINYDCIVNYLNFQVKNANYFRTRGRGPVGRCAAARSAERGETGGRHLRRQGRTRLENTQRRRRGSKGVRAQEKVLAAHNGGAALRR